jgi:SAM-dependent methyltransferase
MIDNGTEKSELDAHEVLTYYDEFYTSDDSKYYPEGITKKFFRGVFSKCHINPPGKILDVGCGTGYYCKIFHDLGFQATGIDFSSTAIAKATEHYRGLDFSVAEALNLPFDPFSFDVILSYGCSVVSTHEISRINDYVRHLMSRVKPGGWLLLIGGSNLSGRRLETSSWLCHTWNDLLRFVPDGSWQAHGPYLSHVRLVAGLGAFGLNRPTTLLFRNLGHQFMRTTFHFVHKF